jgi:hypothetical protein
VSSTPLDTSANLVATVCRDLDSDKIRYRYRHAQL